MSRQLTSEGASSDATQRRQLQKDNAQLRVKITDLLRELDEVRNEREQLGQPSDVVTRLQAKQIAQHVERNRVLEVNAVSTFNVQHNCSVRLSMHACVTEIIHQALTHSITHQGTFKTFLYFQSFYDCHQTL